MNEKVNIQALSEQLSKRLGLSRESADDFVREFFSLITDGLEKDSLVKVKGLGTFKVIDVEDRESVDVNTRERIVIKGHAKVTFTPEAGLKDAINKPFEAFETTILDESTPLEAMTRIPDEDDTLRAIQELYGKSGAADDAIPTRQAEAAPEAVSEPEKDALCAPGDESSELLAESPSTMPENEAALQVDEVQTEPKTSLNQTAVLPEEEPYASDEPSSEEGEEEPSDKADETPVTAEPYKASETAASSALCAPDKETENAVPEGDATRTADDALASGPQKKDEKALAAEKKDTKPSKDSSSGSLKVLSWIILLLILACGVFVCSLYWDEIKSWTGIGGKPQTYQTAIQETTKPEQPAVTVPDTVSTSQAAPSGQAETANPATQTVSTSAEASKPSAVTTKPSTATPVKTEDIKVSEMKVNSSQPKSESTSKPATTSTASGTQNASKPATASKTAPAASTPAKTATTAPSTTQKLKEGVSYKIDGTLTTHVIQRGETLRTIALKYYGSKSFSTYIVQHNAKTIKNPDNVPAGSKINIPKLVEK